MSQVREYPKAGDLLATQDCPPAGAWETAKYRGDTRVAVAHGADFRTAMTQTTMVGVAPDEPTIGDETPEK